MKLSLRSLFVFMALIAVLLGWYFDRKNLLSLNQELIASKSWNDRHESRLISFPSNPYSDAEYKLAKASGQTYFRSACVLEILSLFHLRDQRPENPVVFAQTLSDMESLECKGLSDLQAAIEDLDYDTRIVMDSNHPKHKAFVEFLRHSKERYAR